MTLKTSSVITVSLFQINLFSINRRIFARLAAVFTSEPMVHKGELQIRLVEIYVVPAIVRMEIYGWSRKVTEHCQQKCSDLIKLHTGNWLKLSALLAKTCIVRRLPME